MSEARGNERVLRRSPWRGVKLSHRHPSVRSIKLIGRENNEGACRRRRGLPVVFLDIDDVLCLNHPYGGSDALDAVTGRHSDPDSVLREIFAAEPKRVLESVHEEMGGQLRYVIRSSWRQAFSREQIERVFRAADVGFVAAHLHEKWGTPRRLDRLGEIELWLRNNHKGEPFVVLDDEYSGASLSGIDAGDARPLASRVVLCSVGVGLTIAHVPIILDALGRPLPRIQSTL